MPKKEAALEVGQVVGRRVEELRHGRMTQAQLSDRLRSLGYPHLSRVTVAKIEAGGRVGADRGGDVTRARNISVKDTMALAVALNVAPMHLFVPVDDSARVKLTERVEVSAISARSWVRGQAPLREQDERTYFTEVPLAEWNQAQRRGLDGLKQLVAEAEAAVGVGDVASYMNALTDVELEAQRLQRKGGF